MSKIALFGAAGAIGNSIAAELQEQKQPYRVVGRNRAELEKLFGGNPLAEIVAWNPDDPASVRAACRGVDTLIYLIGVPYNHFELHPVLNIVFNPGTTADFSLGISPTSLSVSQGSSGSGISAEFHHTARTSDRPCLRKKE